MYIYTHTHPVSRMWWWWSQLTKTTVFFSELLAFCSDVIYPSGTSDVENGADESFMHSAETDSLKGSNTPISTGAMMLSPLFLWRIKVLLSSSVGLFPILSKFVIFICSQLQRRMLFQLSYYFVLEIEKVLYQDKNSEQYNMSTIYS